MKNGVDLSRILECTKKIESTLEQNYGATGRGLGEKAVSVKHLIGDQLCKKILFLSTIRNKVFHEDSYQLDQTTKNSFFLVCTECKRALNIFSNDDDLMVFYEDCKPEQNKSKNWKAIKNNQKKVQGKMAASIIPITLLLIFLLMFLR